MSGIYIHIPFCKQACHYCNFHFSTSLRLRRPMIDAIKKELIERVDYLKGATVETVYFGGGTPSLLEVSELMEIWETIVAHYKMGDDLEVTLEANPDDLSTERLKAYRHHTPVNRLSIGIQSFHEADLHYMNRAHSAAEAMECIGSALTIGFQQLSIDLIYGTPTMDDEQWYHNLRSAFAYGVPHLSCYALTVEPKTALQHLIVKGKTQQIDEEQTARQFELLVNETAAQGYEQYEISNFCRPPHYARHNSSYWHGETYLGIGPSAHSFNGFSRQWNIANNAKYVKAITEGTTAFELELLTPKEQYNEYILTALRTKWGVDTALIGQKWGKDAEFGFQTKIKSFMQQGFILQQEDKIVLSNSGKLLADSIISDLFW